MPSRRRWRRRDEERYRDVAWERRERMLATPLIADSLIGRGTAGGRKIIRLLPTRATSHPCGFVVPVPLSREYSEGAEGALKGTYTRGLHAEYTASCNSERLVITVADEVTGNTGDRTGSPARGLLLCADDDLYMRSYTGSYGAPLSALRRTPMAVRRVLRFHYFSLSLINPSRSSTCWGPLESRVLKISSSDVNTGYRLTREGGLMSEVERTRALTQPRRTIYYDQSRSRASSLHAS
ncbi:hypothetical protein ALC60_08809 [Trachymyrmex zeteki]|uniref:Uncharacterized protein n=1 Tax=Mycetomoellerius zeteki TaxID=64791 RepID=A0A151WWC0_9HYME|nr:hypothetical protein ALC60_08809 [Trachymyrmex zeteki]